jgi:hypothetical protein
LAGLRLAAPTDYPCVHAKGGRTGGDFLAKGNGRLQHKDAAPLPFWPCQFAKHGFGFSDASAAPDAENWRLALPSAVDPCLRGIEMLTECHT